MALQTEYITAAELLERTDALARRTGDVADGNRQMHEILVLTCQYGLRNERMAFGNLFSQVDHLCKTHHLTPRETTAVQRMRLAGNSKTPLSPAERQRHCRSLRIFIQAVYGLTHEQLSEESEEAWDEQTRDDYYYRCMVTAVDKEQGLMEVQHTDGRTATVRLETDHLHYLADIVEEGMQLNIHFHGGTQPVTVVVEPDILIDISSLARCFTDYGHHPLSFIIQQLAPPANSQAILQGNFAGTALDDAIHATSGHPTSWQESLRKSFKRQALEFCTCSDLNEREDFKAAACQQVSNIQEAVDALFDDEDGTRRREETLLEPSFVCEQLGLQGRMDLLTADLRLLVEQKSGRNFNIESGRPNQYGSTQKEDNYVQLLLYYAVLSKNFRLPSNHTALMLLYSRYPLPGGLVAMNFYGQLFHEAIRLRNEIVCTQMSIARHGYETVVDRLTADTVNERGLTSDFFNNFIRPQITAITAPVISLPPLDKAYVCRMMTFVYREQLASHIGNTREGHAVADLWNMPLTEKQETGNIYMGLLLTETKASNDYEGYDTLTFAVPSQGENFLPNFRRGDSVYLYAYRDGDEPDARRAILMKATLTDITPESLTLHLYDGQQNPDIFNHLLQGDGLHDDCRFAVEHYEMGGYQPLRSLRAFACAPAERRQLLLGQRPPRRDDSLQLSRSYHPVYDHLLLKARQASDYFLLIGPPGSGKTSLALRYLVEEELQAPRIAGKTPSVLLTAYTNRAVDEICDMLTSADIPFLRVGKEHSCDERYRHTLINHAIDAHPRLSDLQRLICETQVIVGTTSSLQSQTALFQLKHFTLAVVDEASQILEPQIIGLLTRSEIDRFILIGDHKQLPAVVQQGHADSTVDDPRLHEVGLMDCRESLFERLLRIERRSGRTDFTATLHLYGRMHPQLALFPVSRFYAHEHLMPVPLPHQTADADYPRLVFIPSQKNRRQGLSDKVSSDEARIVAQELKKVYERYAASFDDRQTVGVIVPYRNQIGMIRQAIHQLQLPALNNITIDTVERYQGSQRDVIIYSFTIQHRYQLNFLTSNTFEEDGAVIDRKLNVALTRARCQLIITGHEPTLRQNQLFADLIDHVKEHGCYVQRTRQKRP